MEFLIGISWDIIKSLYLYFKPVDPKEKLRHRLSIKEKISSCLYEYNKNRVEGEDYYSEAIIRDIKRIDSYPTIITKNKGASPWFKVGLIGLYPRGIQVLLRWTYIKIHEEKGWIFSTKDEDDSIIVGLLGNIPYEQIVDVDLIGDEHYQLPHIYCKYFRKGQPYDELLLCEQVEGYNINYFMEISDYYSVNKLSRKLGIDESF